MRFDAIVLAGGRSRRLGGMDKAAMALDGVTLLERACRAVSAAGRTVVVGAGTPTPAGVEMVREEPPFGGPAAGIGAGVAALGADAAAFIAILACDVPYAERAIPVLLAAAAADLGADAVVAADDSGKRQLLLGIYRTPALRTAVTAPECLDGMSVRQLFGAYTFLEVPVPAGATRDVDTWHDVGELGIAYPNRAGGMP